MKRLKTITAFTAILSGGAVFGFFYAWVCSTMWGLDTADPRVAIAAMQAMNASVHNAVFFSAFFLTPIVMGIASALALHDANRRAATGFAAAAAIYLGGVFLPTALVNVPMNEALAVTIVPDDIAEAGAIWTEYSPRWQLWNQLRTIASAIALTSAAFGLYTARLSINERV